ncbi:MAG: hypothetical protein KAG06_02750 [Methylococcales bacterium]|nr:hypothetical protein [Methylococcales bacterium]
MKKLEISETKFDINLNFYFFLKHLIKTKLTINQTNTILNCCYSKKWKHVVNTIHNEAENLKGKKKNEFLTVVNRINGEDSLKLFIFSLRLYSIKDVLLAEAKLKQSFISDSMRKLPPLSLEYDRLSLLNPYSTRVSGALLALIFFENLETGENQLISQLAVDYLQSLSDDARSLKTLGVEPNQIFMLVFNESINQSIISDSGLNYEDRIYSVLLTDVGLESNDIQKIHDENDASTEFDFWFQLEGYSYGIGAKKTLRERYKQFIKTSLTSDIDVMIEITIGLDLNKAKAQTIRNHGTYIFLADEIYNEHVYFSEMDGVFPTSELNRKTLLSLGEVEKIA